MTVVAAVGCKKSSSFSSQTAEAIVPVATPKTDDGTGKKISANAFALNIPNTGGAVARGQLVLTPQVLSAGGQLLPQGLLAGWQVSVAPSGKTSPKGPVAPSQYDASQASGLLNFEAQFVEASSQKTGRALATVFVDAEPPQVTLMEVESRDGGSTRDHFWSASDNYALNAESIQIWACPKDQAKGEYHSGAELKALESACAKVMTAADLQKSGSTFTFSGADIQGVRKNASEVSLLIYAEDLVGQGNSHWGTSAGESQNQLSLSTEIALVYTNANSFSPRFVLQLTRDGKALPMNDAGQMTTWDHFDLQSIPSGGTATTVAYAPAASFAAPAAEGRYPWSFIAKHKDSGMNSNKAGVVLVVDRTPPTLSSLDIDVPNQQLSATSKIGLSWQGSDNVGIDSLVVEVKEKGAAAFVPLTTLSGGSSTYSFDWGTRAQGAFEVRIRARDLAGNESSLVQSWIPQVFNAAVLTRDVECFFCHMRIEGDAAGIDFPASVHSASGTGLLITGKFYATNTIPALLKNISGPAGQKVAKEFVENYKNTDVKIFPKNLAFPTLTPELLAPRMMGVLKQKATTQNPGGLFVNRTYTGNLILDGTQAPLQISGEVFVNGDVVIKGAYSGLGTLYAKNIFIVGDVTAVNGAAWPYPSDETQALAQARKDLLDRKDALYLGALDQIVAGDTTARLDAKGPVNNTQAWLSDAEYIKLGAPTVQNTYKVAAGSDPAKAWTPDAPAANRRIEVNRVDAFLYAGSKMIWPGYGNFVLNGGFMSPGAFLVTQAEVWTGSWWCAGGKFDVPGGAYPNKCGARMAEMLNPRNNLPSHTNVIRYDWRLRAGGPGFETLKSFFEQL